MGKANEQATKNFHGQPKLTTTGGLAKSIVEDTYNKIECYGSRKKREAPNLNEYLTKNPKILTVSMSTF